MVHICAWKSRKGVKYFCEVGVCDELMHHNRNFEKYLRKNSIQRLVHSGIWSHRTSRKQQICETKEIINYRDCPLLVAESWCLGTDTSDKTVPYSHLEYPICNCVHSYSNSPFQTPFETWAQQGVRKQWIAPVPIKKVIYRFSQG